MHACMYVCVYEYIIFMFSADIVIRHYNICKHTNTNTNTSVHAPYCSSCVDNSRSISMTMPKHVACRPALKDVHSLWVDCINIISASGQNETKGNKLAISCGKLQGSCYTKWTAQWFSRLAVGLYPQRPEFNPRPVHVGFVVDT
jgi:hypothetical protein